MLIKWANSAHRDIAGILRYFIEIQEKDVGQNLVNRLFYAIELLAQFPHSGRSGQVEGTRELMIPDPSYILIYKVTEHVEIARVLHIHQKWS
ncbi:type II toxin-antitoxin system RelE/ParE family toxin [Desulfovibrio sp. JC022]|uniref:type II toxin-antitoxin system RelE/ParE family toxin n=1 Tax=Desulfovibrio sp. JC022 TaxID=2593642 RepID=UPI0013D389AF|nr:type II toxin-antitoxin system RelE/ParE family toxin [Desulfovibrio sp. JC022]NDV24988.1 type II toxin-antitoxin system RelE/ParE family toxin [Desulfovibrio sp. JC022]